MKIKTLEDAQNLPERSPLTFITKKVVDGQTINTVNFKELVARPKLDADDILFFKDVNGLLMGIDYDKDGAFKYRI